MLSPAPISTVIGRISQENRALGLILAGYADVYAYSKIYDALTTEGEAMAQAVPLPVPVVGTVTPALDAGLPC
jgi:hypothetical protein